MLNWGAPFFTTSLSGNSATSARKAASLAAESFVLSASRNARSAGESGFSCGACRADTPAFAAASSNTTATDRLNGTARISSFPWTAVALYRVFATSPGAIAPGPIPPGPIPPSAAVPSIPPSPIVSTTDEGTMTIEPRSLMAS